MNRFSKQSKLNYYLKKIHLPIIAFIVLFIVFFRGVSSVDETDGIKLQESLTTSLQRSITQCYAIEETYPPDLEYIKEHYGLIYDDTLLFVDYHFIGSNIYPDITIILMEH